MLRRSSGPSFRNEPRCSTGDEESSHLVCLDWSTLSDTIRNDILQNHEGESTDGCCRPPCLYYRPRSVGIVRRRDFLTCETLSLDSRLSARRGLTTDRTLTVTPTRMFNLCRRFPSHPIRHADCLSSEDPYLT